MKVIIYESDSNKSVYWNPDTDTDTDTNSNTDVNNTTTNNTNDNEEITIPTEETVKNNMIVFLTELKRVLQESKSIPFNTTVIANRIENILKKIPVT